MTKTQEHVWINTRLKWFGSLAVRLSKKSFVGFHTARPLATSSPAVGRFAAKQGSFRAPRGRLVASLPVRIKPSLRGYHITMVSSAIFGQRWAESILGHFCPTWNKMKSYQVTISTGIWKCGPKLFKLRSVSIGWPSKSHRTGIH